MSELKINKFVRLCGLCLIAFVLVVAIAGCAGQRSLGDMTVQEKWQLCHAYTRQQSRPWVMDGDDAPGLLKMRKELLLNGCHFHN